MRFVLVLRAAVGLLFGARLLMATSVGFTTMFGWLADYLIIDGALALFVAVALIFDSVAGSKARETALGALVVVDALGRLAAGIAVYIWPGIPDFPVTAMVFLGVMAGCTALLGVVATAIVGGEEHARHGSHHERPQFQVGAVSVAAITSIAFGALALVYLADIEMIQPLLGLYMIGGALVMLLALRPAPRADGGVSPRHASDSP